MKFPRYLFEDFSGAEYLRAKEEKDLLTLIEPLVALGLLKWFDAPVGETRTYYKEVGGFVVATIFWDTGVVIKDIIERLGDGVLVSVETMLPQLELLVALGLLNREYDDKFNFINYYSGERLVVIQSEVLWIENAYCNFEP